MVAMSLRSLDDCDGDATVDIPDFTRGKVEKTKMPAESLAKACVQQIDELLAKAKAVTATGKVFHYLFKFEEQATE